MIHEDSNGFPYYESLDEIRADGFVPVKVKSLLEFFTLAGRKSVLAKDNFIPIPDLKYVVLGNSCYYLREFHQEWTIDMVFFYRKSINFSGDDESIENLRRYADDGRCFLLCSLDSIEQTKQMLQRIYKANNAGEGTLSYRTFFQIAEESLKLEDYKDYGKNLTGFKTTCKIMEDHIRELFKQSYNQNNK